MPLLKSSRISRVEADEDLGVLNVPSKSSIPTKTTKKKNINIHFDEIPNELIINMATYCKAGELARFSQTNSRYLKLLFNQESSVLPNNIKVKSKIKTRPLSEVRKKELTDQEKKYKKDEDTIDFETIQIQVWKRLVCFYFPRFDKALNIKNWMHVLRRRVAHIKIHGNNFLPIISRTEADSIFTAKSDDKFIEKCEYIYKCPLRFDELDGYGDLRSCTVCGKDVHNVEEIGLFKDYISKGLCVSLGITEEEEMGEWCEFDH